jgi:ribosome-associated protein
VPKAKVVAPKAKAATPKVKGAAPKAKAAAPKAAVPKAKAATPKAKAAAPKPASPRVAKAATAAKPSAAARDAASPAAAKPRATAATRTAKAATPAKPAPKPAAPRPARTKKREKLAPDRLALLVEAAMKSLEDDKAENIVLLDVTGRADYADRLIIATGMVERQLQAMATHLDEALGKAGLQLRRDSIQASGDWVLIDAGDLVIHLFRPEARELYRLERMWGPESPGAADATPG